MMFHICNTVTPEYNGWKKISSYKELLKISEPENSVWLLDVSLNWNDNKFSVFHGFDIAKLIRTEKKSKAPIIFYSPIPQVYFEKRSETEIKFKILFGRGSAFIETPFIETKLLTLIALLRPLNNASLHDVVTMLCDLKGIVIDKLNHDLKFEADINKVVGSVLPYLSVLQIQLIGLEKFVSEIKETVKANTPEIFNIKKLQFILLCNQELTEKGKEKLNDKRTKHKVLIIDDLLEDIEKAKLFLKDEFIVVPSTSGEEAIKILKNDLKNEIVAVISDWRLFTNSNQNYWQQLQGYEVLEFAAKNGVRGLFALTSQADFVVHHLRNILGINFSLFKKENLQIAEQWKLFSDVVYEACNESLEIIANIPDSDNWIKTDRAIDSIEEKRILKNHPERNIFIKLENGKSTTHVFYNSLHEQYLEYLHSRNRKKLFDLVDYKADEVWNYLIVLKKSSGSYKGVEILRNKFDIETPKDALLYPVLVLRRIWMALWYVTVDESLKLSQEEITKHSKFIYSIIHNQGFAKFDGNKQSAEQTKLCISIAQVRNRKMLPEEKAWMQRWNLI